MAGPVPVRSRGHLRGYAWRLHLQLVGVGHAIRPLAGLRAVSEEGGVIDVVVNVGGYTYPDSSRPGIWSCTGLHGRYMDRYTG